MTCRHYSKNLESEDRHFVPASDFNNCLLCLIDGKGPMTQEQVGNYMGITKMRVSQIEKQALKTLRKRCNALLK